MFVVVRMVELTNLTLYASFIEEMFSTFKYDAEKTTSLHLAMQSQKNRFHKL